MEVRAAVDRPFGAFMSTAVIALLCSTPLALVIWDTIRDRNVEDDDEA
jgi:hypothetical protein